MNVFDFLNQIQDPVQREQLAAQLSALYAPPEMNAVANAPAAQGNLPPAQPSQPQPQAPLPPAAGQVEPIQVPQAQGPFTSPPGSQPRNVPGAAGTQSGPAVVNPEAEKEEKQQELAKLLAGGTMTPMMGAPQAPQAPVGNGPSLGSASPATGFQMATPTPDRQAMIALAQLLGG